MKFNTRVIFGVLLAASFAAQAGNYPTEGLERLSKEITAHANNQLEMQNPNFPDEYSEAANLYEAAIRVQEKLDYLVQTTHIHNNLVSIKDKELVKKFLLVNKKHYYNQCSIDLKYMNKILTRIKNPALLNESTILRDKVSEGCEAFQAF